VQVFGPGRTEETCQAIIDTGFDGFLTLPADVVRSVGLPWIGWLRAILANEFRVDLPLHEAVVLWEGSCRPVDGLVSPGGPLVGMATFDGSRLSMDVVAGGRVFIEPLST
jgi:predicted aspartyl protease